MTRLRKRIGIILEGVFRHGKYTPTWGMNLPRGQISIYDAANKLEKIIDQEVNKRRKEWLKKRKQK